MQDSNRWQVPHRQAAGGQATISCRGGLTSAMLISDCRLPSLSRICARLRLSASAWSSMAARTPAGGEMSRISYLRHCNPQASAASLMT